MGPIEDEECPLCGQLAQSRLVDFNERKHFRCTHCSDFEISLGALSYLVESVPESRVELADLARQAQEDKALVILMTNPPQPRGLRHEYVLRSQLPRH
jgi:hypothetical protein